MVINQMARGSRTPWILTPCGGQWALLGYPSLLWQIHCSGAAPNSSPIPLFHHPTAEYAADCGCSAAAGRITSARMSGLYLLLVLGAALTAAEALSSRVSLRLAAPTAEVARAAVVAAQAVAQAEPCWGSRKYVSPGNTFSHQLASSGTSLV